MTEETLIMRVGTEYDLEEVMKLSIMAAEENGCMDVSKELLLQVVWPALTLNKAICGVIGADHGFIEGMVVLTIGNLYYSPKPCVEEKVVYVHPKFRSAKGGRARKLCEFSKKVADTLDMPLMIGVCSSHRTQGKVKMYERIFGPPAGAYWLYRTTTGGHKVT